MTRREMFGSLPAVSAMLIMALAAIFATLGTHPILMGFMVIIGVLLVMITIDTGGHSMLMLAAGYIMIALGLTIQRLELGGSMPWVASAVVSLLFADLLRLSFAERRHGVIEGDVYQGVFVGLAVVAVSSGVTIGLVAWLESSAANGNWLLVPLALALAVIGLVGLAIGVSKSPGQYDKRRWKPGERLMAPPRAASDDPSLKTSTPPAPPLS